MGFGPTPKARLGRGPGTASPDSSTCSRRWAVDVTGPWRITFEWNEDGDAYPVDLERYH